MMDNHETYIQVTETFANYGMRKTSMDDLSRVMGVSRQTLYNRFKTKEAIREWAVNGFTQAVLENAISVFKKSKKSPDKVVVEALDRWVGDHFPLWKNTPHGAEVLNFDTELLQKQKISVSEIFEESLKQYLIDTKIAKNETVAAEITFTIMIALKGAFVLCNSSKEYSASMQRVVKLLV